MTTSVEDGGALDVRWDDGVAVLAPAGALDAVAADVLCDAVATILAHERSLVIDLERAAFTGTAPLVELVRVMRRATRHGRDIRLANVPRSVARMVVRHPELERALRAGGRQFVSLSN